MESLIKGGSAVLFAVVGFMYGEWTALLTILVVAVVIDYISGVAAAGYEGTINSRIGLWGIPRKVMIFALVAMAHFADIVIGDGSLVMNATIGFYLANELISITENAGRLGLPVPDVLKNAIATLSKLKGGSSDDNKNV